MTNIKEAYTAVIDFNKTIISITSTILAALISYLVFQDYSLGFPNILSPIALIISLVFSFFGIGCAIPAININQSKIWAVRFSNIGAAIMLTGIILIIFIEKKNSPDINTILVHIEKSLEKVDSKLNQSNCKSFELIDNTYVLNYEHDTIKKQVIYSLDKEKIISLKTNK